MARRPFSVVVAMLAVHCASCALEATGTAPTSTTTGAGPTGAGGDGAATTTTGGPAHGVGGATSSSGGGAGDPSGAGGDAASSSSGEGGGAGAGGGDAPSCGDGVIEGGEECDGPAPCDRCAMVCPPGWTKGATGTCYGRGESYADGDEVVDECAATRDQLAIDAAVELRPATPDVVDDLTTVSLVCGDELDDDGCWIGADDLDLEGMFRWVSGEAFTYTSGVAPWAEGEPSGDDDDANCVEVFLPGGGDRPLHDDECWRWQRVICEIVPPGVPAGG